MRQYYRQFVADGIGQASIWSGLRQQNYLGDERFVARMQQRMIEPDELNVPRTPRRSMAPSLATLGDWSLIEFAQCA